MIGADELKLESSVARPDGLAGRQIRVCYVDPSLRGNLGHFANSCRHIAGELRGRGFAVDVFANRGIPAQLAQELSATPAFRHDAYAPAIAYSFLTCLRTLDYRIARGSFLCDLQSVWRRGPYDMVYINSVLPAQLAALALWLNSFPAGAAPRVAVEFGAPTGSGVKDGHLRGWWQHFPKLYEQAGRMLDRCSSDNLFLFTFDQSGSEEYTRLLGLPVATLPAVHGGRRNPRLRARGRDNYVTVAFLGHQRIDKGYHLLPSVIRRLRSRAVPAKVLVHDGDPDEVVVRRELEKMAAADPNLAFEQRAADAAYWQDLLDRSDLVVLPYEPSRYRAAYSAIAVEAVGEGIPLVVPAGTTMERLVDTYQGAGGTFADWDADAISGAIETAIANFESVAGRAAAGALEWQRANGPGPFVDRLLDALPIAGHPVPITGEAESAGNILREFTFDALFAATTTVANGLMKIRRFWQSH